MLKAILDFEKMRKLERSELRLIKGGRACSAEFPCPPGTYCADIRDHGDYWEGTCRVI